MRDWIVHITAASLLAAMAMAMTPKGRVRQVTRLVCGLMCALAVAGPLTQLDAGALASGLARYEQRAGQIVSQAQEEEKMLERTYIEQQCQAYILGKADESGIVPGEVSVTARWDGDAGVWYPWSVTLGAPYDSALATSIEAELGIPADRQRWADR